MNLSPIVFYGLSAGLVVSAILSTVLPEGRVSRSAQVALLVFCLTLILGMGLGLKGLILAALCLGLSVLFAMKHSSKTFALPPSNFKTDFLVWIVLGSFLLIIAVVLKYTNWIALRLVSLPNWKMILKEYGILLTAILAWAIASLFWKESKKT